MQARNDLLLIIAIVVILGIVWAVTGGPQRLISRQGPFLRPPAPLGSGEAYGRGIFFREPSGTDSGSIPTDERSIEREIKRAQEELNRIQEELQEAKRREDASAYEGKVVIEKRTTGPKAKTPEEEYVVLSASRRNDESVLITGWKLESLVTKKRITIGGATSLYISGIVNSEPAVHLAAGEEAFISTGRSPVGASFRVNKCTGYFEQFQDFTPRLRRECPTPKDEIAASSIAFTPTNSSCFDLVERMQRCIMSTSAFPIGTSNECSNFITETINYTGCVREHRDDTGFSGNEWRMFLGRSEELWKEKREIIQLLDREGKIVDTFTY